MRTRRGGMRQDAPGSRPERSAAAPRRRRRRLARNWRVLPAQLPYVSSVPYVSSAHTSAVSNPIKFDLRW